MSATSSGTTGSDVVDVAGVGRDLCQLGDVDHGRDRPRITGGTQIADLRAASDPGAVSTVIDIAELAQVATDPGDIDDIAARVSPDDVADILFTSGTTGRSKGAMSAHRQTIGVATAWAEARRGRGGRPLPRGQPVLPLLRLQDRHRRRAAHRRDALPRRDLRRRRDDAADRVGRDHRVPGGADAPVRRQALARSSAPPPVRASLFEWPDTADDAYGPI